MGPLRRDRVIVADIVTAVRVLDVCATGRQEISYARQLRGLPLLGTHFQSAPGGSGAGGYDRLTARRRNSLKLSPRSARCAR